MRKLLFEVLCVALPKLLSGAGITVVNLVLLRYFGPEQFGMYSLCVVSILLADGVVGAALDMGVLRLVPLYRLKDVRRSVAIEKAALALKLMMTLTVCLLLLLCAEPLSRYLFQQTGTAHLLYLSSAAMGGLLMLRSALVHLQVESKFALYGGLDLLHNVLKFGGIALLLWSAQVSPGAVLALFVFAPVSVCLLSLATVDRDMLRCVPSPPRVLRELLDVVKWSLLTFSFGAAISRLDIFLLSMRSTMAEVGLFSGGQVFAIIPEFLGTYLGVVLHPRIMPYCHSGQFFAFFRRFQLASLACCGLLYLLAVLSAETIAPYVLPTAFAPSAKLFLILLPGALAGLVTFPLTIAFLMFVRPKFLFTMDCLAAPVIIGLYLYAIQHHGALGAAWVTSASRCLRAAVAQVVAWRWARRTAELYGATSVPREVL